jgi:hypothetical protein
MSIPKFGIYIPEFGMCIPKSETEIFCKDSAFFLKHKIISELSFVCSLFVRMIIGLEDLDVLVVVEDNPGGWFLLQLQFLTSLIP